MPPSALLADVFRQLPFLVIHTTTDGTVLHCNPETTRVTGYEEPRTVGAKISGGFFSRGKLFAQVPKFISLLAPLVLLKDIPMTIRTKAGKERVIAFSRYSHGGIEAGHAASEPRSFICVGVDLTDRLLDSDREKLPPSYSTGSDASGEFMGGVWPAHWQCRPHRRRICHAHCHQPDAAAAQSGGRPQLGGESPRGAGPRGDAHGVHAGAPLPTAN